MIELFVKGTPISKGSMKAIPGVPYPVAQNSTELRAWERAIRTEIRRIDTPAIMGPVVVGLDFHLSRPVSRKPVPKSGDIFKRYPVPATYPDVDKLARAVLDGLNQLAYEDDSRVILLVAGKKYAEPTGCAMRIWGLEEIWTDPSSLYTWLEQRIEGV
jgi:crossover junction endodeoxyribonuclease RusA